MDIRETPIVPLVRVDTTADDWAPQIAFVSGGQCSYALAFQVGSPELAAFTPQVWIAGEPEATVTLDWEAWSSATGWTAGSSTPVTATASTDTIDPAQAASATLVPIALPQTTGPGQFTLYATRQWTRPDQSVVPVRSNPILVTLYPAVGGA